MYNSYKQESTIKLLNILKTVIVLAKENCNDLYEYSEHEKILIARDLEHDIELIYYENMDVMMINLVDDIVIYDLNKPDIKYDIEGNETVVKKTQYEKMVSSVEKIFIKKNDLVN